MVVALAVLTGLPLPILPLQILFLNLVTDVFPAFALATGEGEEDVLRRPPRGPQEPLLGRLAMAVHCGKRRALTTATLGALLIGHQWLGLEGERSSPCRFSPLPSPSFGMSSTCVVPAQDW